MKSTRRLIAISLSVLCLMLSGCKAKETFNWSQLAAPTPSSAPRTTTEQSEGITVHMPIVSGELNPATNPSKQMQGLFDMVYEGLMRLDSRYQPENWLAESVSATPGGYNITLRKGVLFHDGMGLTSKDVVDSFALLIAAKDGTYANLTQSIQSIEALGERELFVKTDDGYQALFALNFPIYRSAVGDSAPAGTGPYVVASYMPGGELVLNRNDTWWRTPALIPTITAIARPDEASVLATFQLGEIDVCSADLLTVSSVAKRDRVRTQDYPTGQAELLLPNISGRLSDIRMRQAIAYALNKKDIIVNTYQNHGVSIDTPVIPDSWLFERGEGLAHDPDKARALLKQLGWTDFDGDGYVERIPAMQAAAEPMPAPTPQSSTSTQPTQTPIPRDVIDRLLGVEQNHVEQVTTDHLNFTILTNAEDSSSHKDASSRIVSQLNAVGIEGNVIALPFAKLAERAKSGDYDMILIGYQVLWSGDMTTLLHSTGENNWMGYKNTRMDTLLDALKTAATADAYYNTMQSIHNQIMTDLPVFTICMRTKTQVSDKDLVLSANVRANRPFRDIETWSYLP